MTIAGTCLLCGYDCADQTGCDHMWPEDMVQPRKYHCDTCANEIGSLCSPLEPANQNGGPHCDTCGAGMCSFCDADIARAMEPKP